MPIKVKIQLFIMLIGLHSLTQKTQFTVVMNLPVNLVSLNYHSVILLFYYHVLSQYIPVINIIKTKRQRHFNFEYIPITIEIISV